MKNYVKPLVVANEELAEGIYADSGTGASWKVGNDNENNGETGPYDTLDKLDFKYSEEGVVPAQCSVTVVYNQSIKYFDWGFNPDARFYSGTITGSTVTFTFNPGDDPEDKTYPFIYAKATGENGRPTIIKVSAQ